MKAVGYTRLSQESDTSIGSQKEDIKSYCSSEGLDLENIFDDGQHSSGYNTDREAYQEMKSQLEDVDVVVVRSRERLGRDFDERMRFILDLRKKDIRLHTVQEGLVDLEDPYSVAVESFHSASDDKKKRQEIERSKKEIEKRQEKGFYQGRAPTGLKFDDAGEELVVDQSEIGLVRDVLDLRDKGYSYPEIEEALGGPKSTAYRIQKRKVQYQKFL